MNIPKYSIAQIVALTLVIFSIIALSPLKEGITGHLTFDRPTFVSVEGEADIRVSRFEFDRAITIGESVNFSVELENEGGQPAPTDYQVQVFGSNSDLIVSYPAPEIVLQPGEIRTRTIKHTPHETGSYTVRLRVESEENLIQTSRFLFVREEPTPQPPPPITVTITRVRIIQPPPIPPPPPPSRDWEVQSPGNVSIAQGTTGSVPITVNSTGEGSLENVELTLRSPSDLSINYTPQIMFNVLPGTQQSFVLRVKPDRDSLGQRRISYTLTSNRLTESGNIIVDIVPELTIEQLRNEIRRMELLILKAEAEIDLNQDRGIDMSEAESLLQDAKDSLNSSRTSLENRNFQETRENLEETRSRINSVYEKIFELRSERLVVEAPFVRPIHVLLLLSLIIATLLVGTYYYMRERRYRRPEMLREEEEE